MVKGPRPTEVSLKTRQPIKHAALLSPAFHAQRALDFLARLNAAERRDDVRHDR